jgi:hypothetical protein
LGEAFSAAEVDVGGALGIERGAHLIGQPGQEATAQRPGRVPALQRRGTAAGAQQRGPPVVALHSIRVGGSSYLNYLVRAQRTAAVCFSLTRFGKFPFCKVRSWRFWVFGIVVYPILAVIYNVLEASHKFSSTEGKT